MTSANFEFNLSIVLAHSLLYEHKQDVPTGIIDDYHNGGDSAAPTTTESMDQILKAYVQNMPALTQATASAMPTLEQAQLASSQATSPAYAQLQQDLYNTYGPQSAAVSDKINANSAQAVSDSDRALLAGTGGQLATEALAKQKELDPNFYKTQDLAAAKIQDLLNGLNSNGLSAGERAEVERGNAQSNNQRGLATSPSATTTTENAMNFGNALNAKKTNIANILNDTTANLGQLKSGVDALQTATGKTASTNYGDTKFVGANQNAGSTTNALGNSLLSSATQMQQSANTINANKRDALDRVNSTMGAIGSL